MSCIGYCPTKTKILLLVVSFWIAAGSAFSAETNGTILKEAEQIQKGPDGDKKAIDFLWSKSEKLERPELLFLSKILIKKKNFRDILKASELALAKNPQDAEFLTFQGKAYLEIGKDKKTLDKVQESLRAAIEANPKFEPAYLILDDYYERQDLLSKKLKKPLRYLATRRILYEDLIQNIGEKHPYLAKLCEINALDGVNEDAFTQCKKAITLKKDDTKSLLNLATVHKQRGEKKEAQELLEKAALDNSKATDILFAAGAFFEDSKNYSKAYTYFKDCVKVSSEELDCVRGVGSTGASLKKWQESFDSFQRLCRKDRKWSLDVRKASVVAKDVGALDWEQKYLDLSANCNI